MCLPKVACRGWTPGVSWAVQTHSARMSQPAATGSGSSQGAGKICADQSMQPWLHSANMTFLSRSPGY